jgi:hypothetical protein
MAAAITTPIVLHPAQCGKELPKLPECKGWMQWKKAAQRQGEYLLKVAPAYCGMIGLSGENLFACKPQFVSWEVYCKMLYFMLRMFVQAGLQGHDHIDMLDDGQLSPFAMRGRGTPALGDFDKLNVFDLSEGGFVLKHDVGIGWVTEGEADYSFPVLLPKFE